jgi:hypothetical protein
LRFTTVTLTVATFITAFATQGLDAQDATARKSPASASKSKSTSSKSTSKSGTSKQTKATPQTTARSTTKPVARRKSSKPVKKPVVASRRWAQQQPTPERLKEIQQALAERGYFRGDPNGTWGPESIDSLKRFQRDQSLVEDGKIGSLSLIALGLGPRRAAPDPAPEKTQN